MGQPISTTYLNVQEARAWAALPAAGAFDAAPTELYCPSFSFVTVYLSYQRGGVGGAVDLRIQVSPDSTGTVWYDLSATAVGAVAAGADTTSLVQANDSSWQTLGAAREYLTYGPIDLQGTVERIRIAAAESGAVGTPGSCEIELRFAP